jgi:hypothetical protein
MEFLQVPTRAPEEEGEAEYSALYSVHRLAIAVLGESSTTAPYSVLRTSYEYVLVDMLPYSIAAR